MANPWIVEPETAPALLAPTLLEFGCAIVPRVLEHRSLERLKIELEQSFETSEFCDGVFYGRKTKRFGRLLSRSTQCQTLALHSLSFDTANQLLSATCQDIQLNLTQGIEIWPDSPSQVPHRDQDIWLGVSHSSELMLNAMWSIDDFTRENGATMIWPGSHRLKSNSLPMSDPFVAEMPAGSLALFLGSTLHCGGANWSERRRRGIVISYCAGWLKPCENPWLAYPPEIARKFPAKLARLVGYRMDAPSLNNFEGRCPSELLLGDGHQRAFADKLTPSQLMQIERYNAEQINARRKAA